MTTTFRIDGFSANRKNDMEKKETTLYFAEGIGFIIRSFGLNVRYKTRCKVEDDGEIECIVIIDADNEADAEKVRDLFENLTVLRKDRFSSDVDITKRIEIS